MPADRTARVAARSISRLGEAATITNYADNGTTDQYGDTTYTESTVSATGLFTRPTQPQSASDAHGEVVVGDAEIWFDDDTTLYGTSDSHTRASEIERDATGDKFRVLEVWDEDNGLIKVTAERI